MLVIMNFMNDHVHLESILIPYNFIVNLQMFIQTHYYPFKCNDRSYWIPCDPSTSKKLMNMQWQVFWVMCTTNNPRIVHICPMICPFEFHLIHIKLLPDSWNVFCKQIQCGLWCSSQILTNAKSLLSLTP